MTEAPKEPNDKPRNEPPDTDEGGPQELRVQIRILDNGDVVFGDLPDGLLDVARILAGSDEVVAADHGDLASDEPPPDGP